MTSATTQPSSGTQALGIFDQGVESRYISAELYHLQSGITTIDEKLHYTETYMERFIKLNQTKFLNGELGVCHIEEAYEKTVVKIIYQAIKDLPNEKLVGGFEVAFLSYLRDALLDTRCEPKVQEKYKQVQLEYPCVDISSNMKPIRRSLVGTKIMTREEILKNGVPQKDVVMLALVDADVEMAQAPDLREPSQAPAPELPQEFYHWVNGNMLVFIAKAQACDPACEVFPAPSEIYIQGFEMELNFIHKQGGSARTQWRKVSGALQNRIPNVERPFIPEVRDDSWLKPTPTPDTAARVEPMAPVSGNIRRFVPNAAGKSQSKSKGRNEIAKEVGTLMQSQHEMSGEELGRFTSALLTRYKKQKSSSGMKLPYRSRIQKK